MDWSKTKTVFIAVFLLLNIFLVIEYYSTKNENKLEILKETSIEEKLKSEKIEYGKLPDKVKRLSKLSGDLYEFTNEDIQSLKKVNATLITPMKIEAKLIEPYKVVDISKNDYQTTFLQEYTFKGTKYKFSSYSAEKKEIIFSQVYDGYELYGNQGAQIIAKLDSENQILSFEQTMLEDLKNFGKKEEIIPPLKALENLSKKGVLNSKNKVKVTVVELGYFTLFQKSYQILEPTWRIEIDNNKNYYVTAFEGEVHQLADNK